VSPLGDPSYWHYLKTPRNEVRIHDRRRQGSSLEVTCPASARLAVRREAEGHETF